MTVTVISERIHRMDKDTKYDSSTLSHWIKISSLYLLDIGSPKRRGGVPTIVLMKTLRDGVKEKSRDEFKDGSHKERGDDPLEGYDDFYYLEGGEGGKGEEREESWEGMLSRYGRFAYLIGMFEEEIARVQSPNMKLFNTFLETLAGSGRGEVWEYGMRRVVEEDLDEGRGRLDVFGLDMYVRFCSKLREYEKVEKVLEMKKRHR